VEWEILVLVTCFAILLVVLVTCGTIITRIRGVERKLNALLRHHGVDPTLGLPLSDRVKEIATDPSRKIEAIKVYRDETGVGLAEAKEAVEMFMNST
jgi:hypothetical protein